MQARVLFGINSIFSVLCGEERLECVIKGKVLSEQWMSNAPLAPGDLVNIERDDHDKKKAVIVNRIERKSEYSRWMSIKNRVQTFAANIDLVVCICSPDAPPFRARFIDRVQVSCEIEDLPLLIVLNKSDLGISRAIRKRMRVFRRLGYQTIFCSTKTGFHLSHLSRKLRGKRCVFVGQSGVGKSSLINRLIPESELKVGEISAKYNRGRHITRFTRLLRSAAGGWIIDTPGIRKFDIVPTEAEQIRHFFPELQKYGKICALTTCTHIHEPNCAVIRAVERGKINEDRYESYLRIFESIVERR